MLSSQDDICATNLGVDQHRVVFVFRQAKIIMQGEPSLSRTFQRILAIHYCLGGLLNESWYILAFLPNFSGYTKVKMSLAVRMAVV